MLAHGTGGGGHMDDALAALAGQIVGTSLIPEIWIAVAVVLWKAPTFGRAMLFALVGAAAVAALRLAIMGWHPWSPDMIAATFTATLVWCALGYPLVAWMRRRRVPA